MQLLVVNGKKTTEALPSRAVALGGSPRMRPTRPLLVLRAGDTIPAIAARHGDFPDWIRRGVGEAWEGPWFEHDARIEAPPPDPRRASGVIVTGSSASVTERATWMLRAEAWLREAVAAETPVLGICFGHQLLAQALGGEVRKNPRGREIGTVELVVHGDDPLLRGLPARFSVNATHVDSVAVLPAPARVLATTSLEPHAVLDLGPRVRGVQFHPEISGEVMRGYVSARRERIEQEGLDADAIHARSIDTPLGTALLGNFVRAFVRG